MIIYKIKNEINGMCYIGLSEKDSIMERYGYHWSKASHNRYLKHAVSYYGLINFSEEIIHSDIENKIELGRLEQFYIKKYNSLYPNGYNFTTGGEIGFELCQDSKDRLSDKMAKEYDLINYLGEEIHIKSLRRFCLKNSYSYACMKNMVRGDTLSSHGWSLKGVDPKFITIPNIIYKLESPENKIIEFTNIRKFCIENKLCNDSILKLLNGRRNSPHRGWKRIGMDLSWYNSKQELHNKYKGYKIISPQGIIYNIDNVYSFAKEHPELDRKDLYCLINKYSIERKGWRLSDLSDNDIREYKLNKKGLPTYYIYDIINKKEIIIKNLKLFSEENNLCYANMGKLMCGIIKKYKNFTFIRKENIKKLNKYKKIIINNGDNEIEANGINELWHKCYNKKINLRKRRLFDIILGRLIESNGWKIKEIIYE